MYEKAVLIIASLDRGMEAVSLLIIEFIPKSWSNKTMKSVSMAYVCSSYINIAHEQHYFKLGPHK